MALTENSADKVISAVKVNGAGGSAGSGGEYLSSLGAICFSNKVPFDRNSILDVVEMLLPVAGEGITGVAVTAPAGCKSVRVYNQVQYWCASQEPLSYEISEFGDLKLGDGRRDRITYASVSLVTGTTGITTTHTDGKAILSEEYYDATGKRVNKDAAGFVIIKQLLDDGSSITQKRFNKE